MYQAAADALFTPGFEGFKHIYAGNSAASTIGLAGLIKG